MNMFDKPEVKQGHLGIGSHQSAAMLKDEWLTPPEIIKALGGPESFDLDPCAPIKRPWDMAKEHYTIADNGLLKPWQGRVWFNPPYGGPAIVGPWMRRMVEHGQGTTLIFARTETALFFETVWNCATAVLFWKVGCTFIMSTGRGQRQMRVRLRFWLPMAQTMRGFCEAAVFPVNSLALRTEAHNHNI